MIDKAIDKSVVHSKTEGKKKNKNIGTTFDEKTSCKWIQ
jgi:hypothetical protein